VNHDPNFFVYILNIKFCICGWQFFLFNFGKLTMKMKTHLEVKLIRSLLAAVGFPRDLIQRKIPEKIQKDSIDVQDLLEACKSQIFELDLHFTFNNKTGNYNCKVLHKSFYLLATESCK